MEGDHVLSMFPEIIGGKTHTELRAELKTALDTIGGDTVSGVWFPWMTPRATLKAVKTFQVREDDVFIITYPKSGTHWINEIIGFVMNDGRDDFERLTTAIEITANAPSPQEVESGTAGYKIFEAQDFSSPRVINTHLPISFLPSQLFQSKAKVIYLGRNPKDNLTSVFTFSKKAIPPFMREFDVFLYSYVAGFASYGTWFDHVTGYWQRRKDDNFLYLTYEDLQKDLRGRICDLAEFVGKDLSDDVIDAIAERVVFTGMQKTYDGLAEKIGEEKAQAVTHFWGSPHLNKGKVGTWKTVFTVAQSALFDKILTEKLGGTGLEFDFEI